MNQFGLAFHHLGLAVREPSFARSFLEGLGYHIENPVLDTEQNVNLVMAVHDVMPAVEIIWATGTAGPLDRMLNKHSKGIVYHVCYVTKNLPNTIQALVESGLEPICVSASKEAVLFGGQRVSFHSLEGIGLIEIIET